jgi:serine/threonine-protein kinase
MRSCPNDRTPTRANIPDPLLGRVLGDRYRVLEPIAAGGMGQVYRAAHTRIASLFAVKVLYGDFAYDAQMRSRFQREAEAASCLQSRHIVRVVDFSESDGGLLYIAMEHLAGDALSSVLATDGPLTPARTIAIAVQIARGLGHAHERGIVHRDLKPGNVMIIREDDELDLVRLLDFGIARLATAAALTQAGAVMGTPEYMAPEQFRGSGTIDGRCDLYALGVMLYEMLSGDIPFYDDDLVKFAHKHFYEPPRPLSTAKTRELVPPELEAIVMRLLEKKPESRFASAREVVDALKAVPLGRTTAAAGRSLAPVIALPEAVAGSAAAERLHIAIGAGAPIYNAGDHAGCARLYREAIGALLAEPGALREGTRIAASARLEVGAARADACRDATRAAWELRWTFDDLLQVLRAPPTGDLALELAAAATVAAPRYAAHELDLVAAYFEAFAGRLAARHRQAGGDSAVASALEAALSRSRGQGAERVLAEVGGALDRLREGSRPTAPVSSLALPLSSLTPPVSVATVPAGLASGPSSYAPAPVSLQPASPGRCAAEARAAARIREAISVGAPAYNAGDRDGCYRTYRDVARELVGRAVADGPPSRGGCAGCASLAALLTTALDAAAPLDASQAAWTMRRAFDQVLDAGTPRR